MPVNEEILTQICHEIKRMRDVLINILPVGNQEDHPQKVGLLCEMYVKICEKQKVLDTLVEWKNNIISSFFTAATLATHTPHS